MYKFLQKIAHFLIMMIITLIITKLKKYNIYNIIFIYIFITYFYLKLIMYLFYFVNIEKNNHYIFLVILLISNHLL